mgnify:CR=1 FL=1
MLENIDLKNDVSKEEYKKKISELSPIIGELQRKAREKKIPIIILFEGWEASGKGTQINQLLLCLDSRGYNFHYTDEVTEEEKLRPYMWRFWVRTPEKGRIAIFNRSWYKRVIDDRVENKATEDVWKSAYEEFSAFEKLLIDDGALIIKFFLHISKKEQKKRFNKLEENPATSWKVSKQDWKQQKKYDKYLNAIEDMLSKTSTSYAPWFVIEAESAKFATFKILSTVKSNIEKILENKESKASEMNLPPVHNTILDKFINSNPITRDEYENTLKIKQKELWECEFRAYKKRLPVIVLFEGWDAAGKGGNIRRLVQKMDPRGYEVIPVAAPNDTEKAHHYLWRFWNKIPKAGHIAIFDRTWYGRVLVERIEGFCSENEWKRAYNEINEMERSLVNFGAVLVKFWLNIDKDEQLKRFKERQENPSKQWKITDEDWRNREKWDIYKTAIDEMIFRTGTNYAPWTIVEANCKYHARIKTISTLIEEIKKKL